MVCMAQVAQVSDNDVKKIQGLEKELGVVLIAYKPLEYAQLDDEQVRELQDVEKNIHATVIAYK